MIRKTPTVMATATTIAAAPISVNDTTKSRPSRTKANGTASEASPDTPRGSASLAQCLVAPLTRGEKT